MRYLGLDIGGKRTGVAVADTELGIASPVTTIESPLASSDALVLQIRGVIEEHGPDALVVGLPLNMDGTEGPQARIVRGFAAELTSQTGLQVHLHDERLTSAAADERMARTGFTHRQKKARRDAIAAAEILAGFLRALETGDAGEYGPPVDAADEE